MKIPSSSSIIFATLAVSASTPSLAAPTGGDTSYSESGLSSSSSNQHLSSRRPSISIPRDIDEHEREVRVNVRFAGDDAADLTARSAACGGPLGSLLGQLLPAIPALGGTLLGILDPVVDKVEGALGLCKAAGAASIESDEPQMVDVNQLQMAAQAVAEAMATASFDFAPSSSTEPAPPAESSAANALDVPSGSAAPPNTPAIPSLPVTPPSLPVQAPVSVPINVKPPVQPGDVTDKLPIAPPVQPGDVEDKLPVQLPVRRRGVGAPPREEMKDEDPYASGASRRWGSRDVPAVPAPVPAPPAGFPAPPAGVPSPPDGAPSPPGGVPALPNPFAGAPALPVGAPAPPVPIPAPVKAIKDAAPVQAPIRLQSEDNDGDGDDCLEGDECDVESGEEDGYDG